MKVNLHPIEQKLSKTAFDLFRHWTHETGISETIGIKSEQVLVADLKESIILGLESLFSTDDWESQIPGWDIGYVCGFIEGNLGRHWHHEYIIKSSNQFKEMKALQAIEAYLELHDVARIRIDQIYEEILQEENNIKELEPEVVALNADESDLHLFLTEEKGKIMTILKNLFLKQLLDVSTAKVDINLPIRNHFSTDEIEELIRLNRVMFLRT